MADQVIMDLNRELTDLRRQLAEFERFLQESQTRYQALLSIMSGMTFRVNREGRYIDFAPGRDSAPAIPPEKFLGKTITETLPPDVSGQMMPLIEAALQTGEVQTCQYQLPRPLPDGELCDFEARLVACGQDEVLALIRDDTGRKKLEEQLQQAQKMEAVGQLAGGVAHDFNNILTAIMGYTNFLLKDLDISDPRREDAESIRHAAERAVALTRQLLAFSRRQILKPKLLNINDTIASLSRMLHRLIGEDIELAIILDPNLGQIRVDPAQMEQVILNLIVNAREAMPRGGTVTVETGESDVDSSLPCPCAIVQPGRYVRLSICDTGQGMDQKTMDRIFEPFFTTKSRGTGLGLAMVYGIVTQSRGHITVDSAPGQGAEFNIYLPVIPPEEQVGVEAVVLPVAAKTQGSETVLVVEDATTVQDLICRILRNEGYHVMAAGYGEEALRLCHNYAEPIDLLITDVVMPGGMSGRELAERLLLLRRTMRVLYISGYTDDAILRHGVSEEKVAFLQKPFTSSALLEKIREILDE